MLSSTLIHKISKYWIFTAIFFIYYIFFLNQGLSIDGPLGNFISDMPEQLTYSQQYLSDSWLQLMHKDFDPVIHILFACTAHILYFITDNSLKFDFANAGALWLATAKLAQFVIIKKIVDASLELSEFSSLFLTIVINFCTVLFLPFVTLNTYLVMGTPNTLHNPTTILLTPFALAFFYQYIKKFILATDPSYKDGCWLSLILVFSTLIKPAFVNIMLLLIASYYLFHPKRFISGIFWKDIIIFVPAIIILLFQLFLISQSDAGGGLIFAPFKVIRIYTHHPYISLLQAILFPLLITVVWLIRQKLSIYIIFSWFFTIIAYLIFALFSFSGSHWYYGNLGWSYQIALTFLYLFSIIDCTKLITDEKNGYKHWMINCCSIGLCLVFLSGIYRFIKIFLGGSYG